MHIDVTISGMTPLICNRFTDEAAESASSGRRSSAAARDHGTPAEIAATKLYRSAADEETPVIPQPNLLRCLVEGGRFHKVGKSQLTTARGSQLFSCLDILESEIPIKSKAGWQVDTRAVRIPSTGGRILAHRPMFQDWSLTFTIEIDTDICAEKLLRMVIDDAGKRVGLGDFRPQCKGPFGKFVVAHWQQAELAMAAE